MDDNSRLWPWLVSWCRVKHKHGKLFRQLPKINQCQLKGSSVWVNSLPEGLKVNTNLSKCYCITQMGGKLISKLPAHLWIASCSFHVFWAGCQLLMTGKYKTFKRIYNNKSLFLIRSLLTFLRSEQSFVCQLNIYGVLMITFVKGLVICNNRLICSRGNRNVMHVVLLWIFHFSRAEQNFNLLLKMRLNRLKLLFPVRATPKAWAVAFYIINCLAAK